MFVPVSREYSNDEGHFVHYDPLAPHSMQGKIHSKHWFNVVSKKKPGWHFVHTGPSEH